jgi:hypothetical protein
MVAKPIYFKYARTLITQDIVIDPTWTLNYFINHVKTILNRQDIELVETGQDNNDGRASEDMDAVIGSDTITVYRQFYKSWPNGLAFYIRICTATVATNATNTCINATNTCINATNTCTNATNTCTNATANACTTVCEKNEPLRICNICTEQTELVNKYKCVHEYCIDCYSRCLVCPECRQPRR